MGKKAQTRTDLEIFRDAFRSAFGEDVEVTEGPEIDKKLLAPHKCSIHHRLQIEASKLCGCFSCLSTFPPWKIEEWTDAVDTVRHRMIWNTRGDFGAEVIDSSGSCYAALR